MTKWVTLEANLAFWLIKFLLLFYYHVVVQLSGKNVNAVSLKPFWLNFSPYGVVNTGAEISMATQFQGPWSDPRVSYKQFWQELHNQRIRMI